MVLLGNYCNNWSNQALSFLLLLFLHLFEGKLCHNLSCEKFLELSRVRYQHRKQEVHIERCKAFFEFFVLGSSLRSSSQTRSPLKRLLGKNAQSFDCCIVPKFNHEVSNTTKSPSRYATSSTLEGVWKSTLFFKDFQNKTFSWQEL